MSGWSGNIERTTVDNHNFRTVLATGTHLQLVVMRLEPGQEIGLEVHEHGDQFLKVEEGAAMVTLGPDDEVIEQTVALGEDWGCVIPAGTWHNVINCGKGPLKLYSIYAPPEHPDGTVHHTKADAEADEHH
ncbi:MAG: cupin domain-containing protein [Candidatus Phosphoribacter baldrii]|nr:cupin domain-containing protein [Dermatophilaceae bacterium]